LEDWCPPFSGTDRGLSADLSISAAIAQRFYQQREGGRDLAAAGIIKVVAGEGRAPVFEHADQPAIGELVAEMVLGKERDAEAGDCGGDDHVDIVEHELALDPHP